MAIMALIFIEPTTAAQHEVLNLTETGQEIQKT